LGLAYGATIQPPISDTNKVASIFQRRQEEVANQQRQSETRAQSEALVSTLSTIASSLGNADIIDALEKLDNNGTLGRLTEQLADVVTAIKEPHEVKLINPVNLQFRGGIEWTGKYDPKASYHTGDGVMYEGSCYVAVKDTEKAPTDTKSWKFVVSRGEPGKDGISGPQGPKGEKGERGDQGPQGVKGDRGDKGDQGAPGLIGPAGPQGERGRQGERGIKGEQGIQGPSGVGFRGQPGQGVATGGTTGQVLKKASNDDYDTEWVTSSGTGVVETIVAGNNVTVDATDPANPIVNASAQVSDAVYGSDWNGDTTTAPSKNAIYDKIETITAGSGITEELAIAYAVAL
jgi:hypothetical protein